MTHYHVIRLGESPGRSVSWIAADDHGTRIGQPGKGTLEEAAREARDRPVIVLVPSSETLTLAAEIPAKGGARLMAALPYALEDQVADEIENLHFAPGRRLEDGRLLVAVVAREKMDEWLMLLAGAGLSPVKLIPENHGVEARPNTICMLASGDAVMVNDGADTVFSLPGIRPGEALGAAGFLDESSEGPKHLLVYCDTSVSEEYEKDWALLRHELDSVDVQLLPDGVLPRLAVTVASGRGINLLQGAYGAKVDVLGSIRPWRYAAILLLALGVVGLAGKAADYYRLAQELDALQSQFMAEYRAIRPNDNREIVDPSGAVNSLARSIGGPNMAPQLFLPSLVEVAGAIRQNDAARVEAINYRAGVITVRVNAPDVPTLDKIVQSIAASGRFSASMQSADSVGDRVNSRIEIREAG